MLFRSNQALIYESKHLSELKAVFIHAEVKQAMCADLLLPPGYKNIIVVLPFFLKEVWKPTQKLQYLSLLLETVSRLHHLH